MGSLWNIFKIIFSAILCGIATIIFLIPFLSDEVDFQPFNIGLPAVLILFAAMPWLFTNLHELSDKKIRYKRGRVWGLAGIIFSMGAVNITIAAFNNTLELPMQCSSNGELACTTVNFLYNNYGNYAVGSLLLLISCFFIFASVILIRRSFEKT